MWGRSRRESYGGVVGGIDLVLEKKKGSSENRRR